MIWVKTVLAVLLGLLLGTWLAQLVESAGISLGSLGQGVVMILVAASIGYSNFKSAQKKKSNS